MTRKCEIVVQKCDFRGQKWVIGLEKLRAGNQTRKAKWCKMQVVFLKIDKSDSVKDQKKGRFTYFMAYVFARTEREKERCCKIKDNILRF